jgi:hypothetical protein
MNQVRPTLALVTPCSCSKTLKILPGIVVKPVISDTGEEEIRRMAI